MTYDFSDAKSNQFEVIPAGTQVPLRLNLLGGVDGTPENAFIVSKDGSLLMLSFECVVTDGQYAKRKIWWYMSFAPNKGATLTKGQNTAIDITRANIRAILEAARGYAPTDDSDAAMKSRTMKSVRELDGLEINVVLGVEKDAQYGDKNKVMKIVPHGMAKPATEAAPAKEAKKAAWA